MQFLKFKRTLNTKKKKSRRLVNVRPPLSVCWPSFCGVFQTVASSLLFIVGERKIIDWLFGLENQLTGRKIKLTKVKMAHRRRG